MTKQRLHIRTSRKGKRFKAGRGKYARKVDISKIIPVIPVYGRGGKITDDEEILLFQTPPLDWIDVPPHDEQGEYYDHFDQNKRRYAKELERKNVAGRSIYANHNFRAMMPLGKQARRKNIRSYDEIMKDNQENLNRFKKQIGNAKWRPVGVIDTNPKSPYTIKDREPIIVVGGKVLEPYY